MNVFLFISSSFCVNVAWAGNDYTSWNVACGGGALMLILKKTKIAL